MVDILDGFLLVIAFGILAWGVERYRTRFVKSDLLIAVGSAGGLVSVVLIPGLFNAIGTVLDIEQQSRVILLLGNLALFGLVLYSVTALRETRNDLSTLTRTLSVDQAPQTDGGQRTIYVVIPAYNEAATIRSVVQSLPETIRGYAVQAVVVSDGSADNTVVEAQYNGAIVVEHPVNQGQGGALKTGFEIAQRNNATIVVTMDGDGQHPVAELERLVTPIIDDEADYVMGSRYKGTDASGISAVRHAGIRFFTAAINVLTKSAITDCTNGFRAIRGSELDDFTLAEERFSAPELIIEARKQGLRLQEIPITIEERQAGETKKPQLGYAIGLSRTILTTWLR